MRKVGVPMGGIIQEMNGGVHGANARRFRLLLETLEYELARNPNDDLSVECLLSAFGLSEAEVSASFNEPSSPKSPLKRSASVEGFESSTAMDSFYAKYSEMCNRGCRLEHILLEARNSGATAAQLDHLRNHVRSWERARDLDTNLGARVAEAKTAEEIYETTVGAKRIFSDEKGDK